MAFVINANTSYSSLCFGSQHNQTPAYIASLITPSMPRHALQSADRALLAVPHYKLELYRRHCFSKAGPTLRNELPDDLHSTDVKAHLKTFF